MILNDGRVGFMEAESDPIKFLSIDQIENEYYLGEYKPSEP